MHTIMSGRMDYFTLTVPFSSIPLRYSEPLSIETEMEYTLEEEKFPGLHDNQHILQPALMIDLANSQDCEESEILHFSEWSNQERSKSEELDQGPSVPQPSFRDTLHQPDQTPHRPTTLSDARGDLAAILSDIERYEEQFARSSNPFDIMPALLSAVTFENGNYPANPAHKCPRNYTMNNNAHPREQTVSGVNDRRTIKLCRRLNQPENHKNRGSTASSPGPVSFRQGSLHLWTQEGTSYPVSHYQPEKMFSSCGQKRSFTDGISESSSSMDYRNDYGNYKRTKTGLGEDSFGWLSCANIFHDNLAKNNEAIHKRITCTSELDIGYQSFQSRQRFCGIVGY